MGGGGLMKGMGVSIYLFKNCLPTYVSTEKWCNSSNAGVR